MVDSTVVQQPSATITQPSARARAWKRFWRYPLSTVGIVGILFLVCFSFIGPLFYHVNPLQTNVSFAMHAPTAKYPLGTDDLGRNELARMMVGGRASLIVGFLSALIAMLFGTFYGMISALSGKWVDMLMMRIVDVVLSIPSLFILLFLDAVFKPSTFLMVFVIASTSWLGVSRLVRAEVLRIRTETYVEAAQLAGVGTWRMMIKYLIPNFIGTVLVTTTFSVADSILTIAGLSFLGLGLPPPAPNWGAELSTAMNYMYQNSWWLIYPPGILILISQLSVNFVGDGLRHALETRTAD